MNATSRLLLRLGLALLAPCAALPAAAASFAVHGTVDATAASRKRSVELVDHDAQFDPYRVNLFADVALSGGLQVFTQLLVDDSDEDHVRAYGAHVVYTPVPSR